MSQNSQNSHHSQEWFSQCESDENMHTCPGCESGVDNHYEHISENGEPYFGCEFTERDEIHELLTNPELSTEVVVSEKKEVPTINEPKTVGGKWFPSGKKESTPQRKVEMDHSVWPPQEVNPHQMEVPGIRVEFVVPETVHRELGAIKNFGQYMCTGIRSMERQVLGKFSGFEVYFDLDQYQDSDNITRYLIIMRAFHQRSHYGLPRGLYDWVQKQINDACYICRESKPKTERLTKEVAIRPEAIGYVVGTKRSNLKRIAQLVKDAAAGCKRTESIYIQPPSRDDSKGVFVISALYKESLDKITRELIKCEEYYLNKIAPSQSTESGGW